MKKCLRTGASLWKPPVVVCFQIPDFRIFNSDFVNSDTTNVYMEYVHVYGVSFFCYANVVILTYSFSDGFH